MGPDGCHFKDNPSTFDGAMQKMTGWKIRDRPENNGQAEK
jgi:hypothetical protein